MTDRFREQLHQGFVLIFGVMACFAAYYKADTAVGFAILLLGRSFWDLYSLLISFISEVHVKKSQLPADTVCLRLMSSTLFLVAAIAVCLISMN